MATSTGRSTSLVLLFLPHLLFVSSFSAPTKAPSSGSLQVKSLCDAAPFPDLCYNATSALPQAANDPAAVARSVLGLCLSSAKAASGQVKGTALDGAHAQKCATSMADCVDVLGQAVEELDRLGPPASPGYALRLGNVQARAQSAISDAEACAMVLEEVPAGGGVLDAGDTVMRTMQLTSNALVFVNSLNASKH